MFVANPLAKMLMYADHQRSITYVEMLRWAREFGVDLPDFFDEANQELYVWKEGNGARPALRQSKGARGCPPTPGSGPTPDTLIPPVRPG